MPRYFIEVAYKGTHYSGFQMQQNANTIQSEVEKAFKTIHKEPVAMTGSSRTDAGVHALQNFFHFDFDGVIHPKATYKLNAVLPEDIVVKNVFCMPAEVHSRFDAISREYGYNVHQFKNPFLKDTSFYYPYKLNFDALKEGASLINKQANFFAFAKTNTQVNNFTCTILKSDWQIDGEKLIYQIEANRFLRGMVRLITATLLQLGRDKISLADFKGYFETERKCGFSVPPHGLHLEKVTYPKNFFTATPQHLGEF